MRPSSVPHLAAPAGDPGDATWLADAAAEARAARHGNVVVPLAHLATLRASGPDSDEFLQGQLSYDLRQLAAGRAQLAAYSSPKGRVLAVCRLRRGDDGSVLIDVSRRLAEPLLKRLRMFVLRAKVRLDVEPELGGLGVAGDAAADSLGTLGLPLPAAAGELAATDALQILREPGSRPRYALLGPEPALAALWPALAARALPAGTDAWRLLDIDAGLPVVYPETQDHFVAQMLNLDQLGAISFDKGCYTGQEVIARLHYLGQLKRRLFRLRTDGASSAAPGTPVVDVDGAGVGEVVDSAADGDGRLALTAVLQLSGADGELRLAEAGGAALTRLDQNPN